MSTESPSSPPSSVHASPERVYVRSMRVKFSTQIDVQIKALDTGSQLDLRALLDSGATGLFLSTSFVERNNLNTQKLERAVPVYNVDGSLNQGGSIKDEVDVIMTYQGHTEKATFAICDLGDKDAIIGHTWLFSHNPEIDWQSGQVKLSRCPPKCRVEVNRKKSSQQHRNRKFRKATGRILPLPVLQEEVEEPEVSISHRLSVFQKHRQQSMPLLPFPRNWQNSMQMLSQTG
jgi:hypothetical protein